MSSKPVRPPHSAWFVLVWATVIAVIVSTITWWVLRPQASGDPTPTPTQTMTSTASATGTPSPEPVTLTRQHSLLVQVRNPDELAVNNAIIVVGGDVNASVTTTLPGLMVNVAGDKPMTLGETAKVDDTLASVDAMTDLLGARIDGGLVLDPLALAGLVDSVGGITINVKQPLLATQGDNKIVDIITPGTQTFDGVTAMEYALTLGDGQTERMARFTEVWNAIVLKLPDSPELLRQLITSLGSLARGTVPNEDIVDILSVLHTEAVAGKQRDAILPVIDVKGDELVKLNRDEAAPLVSATMPELLLPAGATTRIRINVVNGTGSFTQGVKQVTKLVADGYAVLDGGVIGPQPETTIEIPGTTTAAIERGRQIAADLGVPATAVTLAPGMRTGLDANVILGKDIEPAD